MTDDKDIRDKVLKTMLNTPPKPHKEHEKSTFDFEEALKDLPDAPLIDKDGKPRKD